MQNWKVTSYAARSHKREHNQKTQMPPGLGTRYCQDKTGNGMEVKVKLKLKEEEQHKALP